MASITTTHRLHFVGTGTAFNHDARGSQALVVDPADGPPFLVDAGPTVMHGMSRLGLDPEPLDELFLTHLHGDHIAGWPFLLLHMVILHGRSRPFTVRGPQGSRQALETLATCCYGDVLELQGFELAFDEFPVARARGLEGCAGRRFDVEPLRHHPTSSGLRLHLSGLRLAVSGDTSWCPGLEQLARDTDLLVLECTTVRTTTTAHISLDELRERRSALACPRIVLVHLPDRVAEELASDPIPGVTAAHDGLTLHI